MHRGTTYTALLLVIVLTGCDAGVGEQRAPAVKERQDKRQAVHEPYYHGLIEEYRLVLAQDPRNRAATIALANAYFDTENWKDAIIYYERSLRLEPNDPDVRTDLGTSYRNSGMPDRAIEEYRKVLKSNPAHENARYNLGIVYAYDKKNYVRAVEEWEELLRISPGFSHADVIRQAIKSFKSRMSGKGES